jgi:diguanylate cyclase (GGDEF)-like protein
VRAPFATTTVSRRLLPYAATTLLAFVLVALDKHDRHGELAVAAALACVVVVLAVTLPWRSLPRAARLAPALLFLVAVFLLRDSVSSATAGVGVLALLPICWLSLYGTRGELFVGLVGLALFWALPVVVVGGADYPVAQLRTATLYVAVASMIGLTVQSLVRALALEARNVARIAAAARSISSARDARGEICAAACDVSGASFALLFEPTGEGAELRSTAMAGLVNDPVVVDADLEVSATAVAFKGRQPIFIPRADEHPAISRRMWEEHGRAVSMLFEPVLRADVCVGVMVVGWPRRMPSINAGGPALIALLAAEAASAIAHADLVEQLGELASTDPLTGLPNRRIWDLELARVLDAEPHRDGCVAMLDLDNFKGYNDAHGHLAGDRLLKQAAAAWQAQLRPGDVLARLGGEEFAVLLANCALSDAASVVERLRTATPGGQTCSAGLVASHEDEPAEDLMARADAALYVAKHAGRDRLATIAR